MASSGELRQRRFAPPNASTYRSISPGTRKATPCHATWPAYSHSTGLRTVDFRLVDAITDPPGFAEAPSTETPQHTGGCLASDRPPENAPPVFARATVNELFAAHDIDPARLDFRGRSESPFEFYRDIDIALDPLNYNGTTTTCETLWMGVPVVTLRGDRHAARVGASLLTAAALPELVAEDASSYVALAVQLAEEIGHWRRTRGRMRANLAASPLLDATRFARNWRAAIDAGLAQRV
jgi:protein O-GlcNAc transferase